MELQTEKRRKRSGLLTKTLVWTGIILFIAATIGANLYHKKTSTAFAPQGLKTTIARKMTMNQTLLASGKVEPAATSQVYLDPSKGNIAEVFVSQGDKVNKGDKLFRYDGTKIKEQLYSLKLKEKSTTMQIDHRKSQMADLENQISNAQNKNASDSVINPLKSQKDDLAFQNQLSEIDIQQDNLQINQAKQELNGLVVKSTLNGTVRNVATAPYNAQEPVVTIFSGKPYQIQGTLTEYDSARVKQGESVTIQTRALSNKEWKGIVSKVGTMPVQQKTASPNQQSVTSYPFIITIKGKTSKLRPGYHVNAEIVVEQHKNATVVPLNAILKKNNKSYLFIVKKGKLHRIRIHTGFTNGNDREVTKGVGVGNKIVLNPTNKLKEGMVIRHDRTK